MVPAHIVARVDNRINELLGIVRNRNCTDFAKPNLLLEFFPNHREAGVFSYPTDTLWFNPIFLTALPDYYIEHVIPHEFAHVIQFRQYGKLIDDHGAEWRGALELIQAPDVEVYHNIDPSIFDEYASNGTPHVYSCGCPGHVKYITFGNRRHRLITMGEMDAICPVCNEQFQFVRTINPSVEPKP
jgi:predicted SprT family Zn-dependent metalloprotease